MTGKQECKKKIVELKRDKLRASLDATWTAAEREAAFEDAMKIINAENERRKNRNMIWAEIIKGVSGIAIALTYCGFNFALAGMQNEYEKEDVYRSTLGKRLSNMYKFK